MKYDNMDAYRSLGAAICLQAVKDYVNGTTAQRKHILNELRNQEIVDRTFGMSIGTADQLEYHLPEIAERLRRNNTV